MKFREDIGLGVGCLLGVIDGGCTALYVSLPHLLLVIMRAVWLFLFIVCAIICLHNYVADKRATAVTARNERRQQINKQWVEDYEKFRQEMHGKDGGK